MALINCPECATQISDKATPCPKCGCPISRENIGTSSNIVTTQESSKTLKLCILIFAGLLSSCSYNVAPETYESTGVTRLYALPADKPYENLGIHGWGFYRPSFSEPSMGDVWGSVAKKIKALGGNACIVRNQDVNDFTARNIKVTCEVLYVKE